MYACMYVRMYVCTYVRMYVCTYVCMYVRIYEFDQSCIQTFLLRSSTEARLWVAILPNIDPK